MHPSKAQEMMSGTAVTELSKRRRESDGCSVAQNAPPREQARLEDCTAGRTVSQQQYEELIENFVIGAAQPFAVVEQEDFGRLLKSLAPGRKPLTRRVLMQRISDRFVTEESRLQQELLKAKCVAVTADCWKSYNSIFRVFGEKDQDDNDDSEVECHDLTALLDQEHPFRLPSHQMCAAHSLNLVATVDVREADKDPACHFLSKSVASKKPMEPAKPVHISC